MSLRTLDNPYRGINAHPHSLAQNPQAGSPTIWTSIHAMHIGHLIAALNERLPAGYVARPEQSLQIWTEENESYVAAASVQRYATVRPFLEREITIPAGIVYRIEEHEIVGKPVTRIELLSATNKRGGFGIRGYLDNRWLVLSSGTSLIEMDYLHQTVSPLPDMPHYPKHKDSHAYTIAVTDRRPGQNPDDEMLVYIMDVDQSLPMKAVIPLAENDSIEFDFEAAYQHTFTSGRWGIHIDYAELPRNFESYSPADQQRIRQVMERAKPE
jgi:hypothetical protein